MELPDLKEKWSSAISAVRIGATAEEGGTRKKSITVGGHQGLPHLKFESPAANPPVFALEVQDRAPGDDWPEVSRAPFADVLGSPAEWAAKCVEEYGAEMIYLRLLGTHPDFGDASPDKAAETVRAVLKAVDTPIIIWGCDDKNKDNAVLPVCAQAAARERCLIGSAKEDNYKTLVAACQADGHALATESPIDINIAKQVNILVSEMGFPLDRVVMYPTCGALGYGIEYVYSILERGRLAALAGDRMMAMPIIILVGQEAWRAKEAKAPAAEAPEWGDEKQRGILWEVITATTLMQAGTDIVVMRHPKAMETARAHAQSMI